jgi:hypothetical protein
MKAQPSSSRGLTRCGVVLGLATSIADFTRPQPSCVTTGSTLHEAVAAPVRKLAAGQLIDLKFLLPEGSGANANPVLKAFQEKTGVPVTSHERPVDDIKTKLTLNALSKSTRGAQKYFHRPNTPIRGRLAYGPTPGSHSRVPLQAASWMGNC